MRFGNSVVRMCLCLTCVANLAAGHVVGHFLDPGCTLLILLSSLLTAPWAASGAFSPTQQISNAFACYYWTLILVSACWKRHGRQWSQFLLPIQTVRGILSLCSHSILSVSFWEPAIPFRPASREERFMEAHFSRCKQGWRGTPTLKCGLMGTTKIHLEQSKFSWKSSGTNLFHEGLPAAVVSQLAKEALKDACSLQSSISINITPDEVRATLNEWWDNHGPALVGEVGGCVSGSAETVILTP